VESKGSKDIQIYPNVVATTMINLVDMNKIVVYKYTHNLWCLSICHAVYLGN